MREASNSAYFRWSVNGLICSDPALQQGPMFYGAVARSTTAGDFIDFIGDAIAAGWLRAGNAPPLPAPPIPSCWHSARTFRTARMTDIASCTNAGLLGVPL